MQEVSRTEIGRRMYQLHKEKTVEQVIEKLRNNLGAEWKTFAESDVHLLSRLLGAAWATMDKKQWEKIPFARMTGEDVKRILDVSRYIDIDKKPQRTLADNLEEVLLPQG